MDAIKLNLDSDKLKSVNHAIEVIKIAPTNDRKTRVARSILLKVYKRLAKKQIDIYPSVKKFKFKIEYFEADVLEDVLRSYLFEFKSGSYMDVKVAIVADEINQKLA